jgi:hypothetical protein
MRLTIVCWYRTCAMTWINRVTRDRYYKNDQVDVTFGCTSRTIASWEMHAECVCPTDFRSLTHWSNTGGCLMIIGTRLWNERNETSQSMDSIFHQPHLTIEWRNELSLVSVVRVPGSKVTIRKENCWHCLFEIMLFVVCLRVHRVSQKHGFVATGRQYICIQSWINTQELTGKTNRVNDYVRFGIRWWRDDGIQERDDLCVRAETDTANVNKEPFYSQWMPTIRALGSKYHAMQCNRISIRCVVCHVDNACYHVHFK